MVKSSGLSIHFKPDVLGVRIFHMDRKPLDLSPGKGNFKVRAARLYSDVFSPPSVYAIFAFFIAWSHLPFLTGTLHAAIFGTLTALLPMIYILFKINQGQLNDIHLSQPGERTIPYLLSAFGSLIAYLSLRWVGSSMIFLAFILTVITGLLALAAINTKWMISAHTASISAVTAFAGFAFNPNTALAISPLILSTLFIRHYLKRHTLLELISGIVLGILVVSSFAVFGCFRG